MSNQRFCVRPVVQAAAWAVSMAALWGAMPAMAMTDVADLSVSASVSSVCDINAPGTLNIGTFEPNNALTDSSVNVDVTCNFATITIEPSSSANYSGGTYKTTPFGDSSTDFGIPFMLYADSNRTAPFVPGSPMSVDKTDLSKTIYARVAANAVTRSTKAGSHSALITLTITGN